MGSDSLMFSGKQFHILGELYWNIACVFKKVKVSGGSKKCYLSNFEDCSVPGVFVRYLIY